MISARHLSHYQRALDEHLNAAARARRYDSIHTAALRAGYAGPFHDEGVVFATWMDDCNATGYTLLAEIEAGTRAPMSVAEFISLLPPLVLP